MQDRAVGTAPRASSSPVFDVRNTAARLGHGGGGATSLRHNTDPVPEAGWRGAAYLAQQTAESTP
jgi:hypothetical protein